MDKKILSKGILLFFFTFAILFLIKDLERYQNIDTTFNKNHTTEISIQKSDDNVKKSFSERKKKIKGIVGKDNPNLFAKFHNDIRTRSGEAAPKYPLNYKVKELLKAKSVESTKALHKAKSGKMLNWIERGPGNVSGRTRGLIVDPDDPTNNTWFAGSVGGGVWKTENAGQSWIELTVDLPNLATCALAMAASNHNVIYVGTGEGFYNIDQIDGNGIWKTTDQGITWEQLESTANNPEFQNIMRIIVDPTDEDVLLVATVPGTWLRQDEKPNSGLFRSVDGGETWEKVYESDGGDVQQIISNPQNFNTQFATIRGKGVIKSTDGGKIWKNSSKGITKGQRMEIAISPTDTSRLYISAESSDPNFICFC